ncbi:MAG: hypothetical protein ACRD0U_07505 [Acidimicrobiales bacterium]
MLGVATLVLGLPAVLDVIAVSAGGRSLVDRLFRTVVLARR